MKIEKLACPSCGAPFSGDVLPNRQFACPNCGSTLMITDFQRDDTIICPQCRTPNREEMRFCSDCGHQIRVSCVLCHSENRVDVIHCVRCGAHLERARAKREALQAAKRQAQKERDRVLREKEARQQQEKLERLLADLDDPENHEFVIFQLNQMGDNAVEALVKTLLRDHDVDARYGSAIALGQICATQEVKALIKARAIKGLIKALADPEPAVRYWSADALSKCRSQAAVEPLAALLKDSHNGVRQQARQALQKIGGKQAGEILDKHAKGFISWVKGN